MPELSGQFHDWNDDGHGWVCRRGSKRGRRERAERRRFGRRQRRCCRQLRCRRRRRCRQQLRRCGQLRCWWQCHRRWSGRCRKRCGPALGSRRELSLRPDQLRRALPRSSALHRPDGLAERRERRLVSRWALSPRVPGVSLRSRRRPQALGARHQPRPRSLDALAGHARPPPGAGRRLVRLDGGRHQQHIRVQNGNQSSFG